MNLFISKYDSQLSTKIKLIDFLFLFIKRMGYKVFEFLLNIDKIINYIIIMTRRIQISVFSNLVMKMSNPPNPG